MELKIQDKLVSHSEMQTPQNEKNEGKKSNESKQKSDLLKKTVKQLYDQSIKTREDAHDLLNSFKSPTGLWLLRRSSKENSFVITRHLGFTIDVDGIFQPSFETAKVTENRTLESLVTKAYPIGKFVYNGKLLN